MMLKQFRSLLSVALVAILLVSCQQPRLFKDDNAWREVEKDFLQKKEALPHGELFAAFDQSMTTKEREAMTFLYAYMPIGDVTDYSGAFYLQNIQSSFRARVEMPWGCSVPEEIFRHFVLPVRVNNENMDNSRLVFYNELKERVKNLSLYDAVLEVNHWCHEKVIYTPSDARTSSPLASVRTAHGRCGEESVFTVAALRAVGIPARQVYTPRWAHTDDNHAWVEAWVDGKWYFLGACEPEPVLNMAWFNEPVARGMLMHTKVFGKYNGPEEIMERTACYTEINVTANYAPTATVTVQVEDESGAPVADASVEYKIYNYAEFYSVARKRSDAEGRSSLLAGKGDMLVWASKEGKYGFKKVSFGKDEQVVITLNKEANSDIDIELDIVPPVAGAIRTEVTEEQKAGNARRLLAEDSIRNRYTATFYTEERAREVAKELGMDEEKVARFLVESRGNHPEIEKFLRGVSKEEQSQALTLLQNISAKDLRDTPADVLSDHLPTGNPRVSNELLTPYRAFLYGAVDEDQRLRFRNDPHQLVVWVKENIRISEELNPQRIPIQPIGVWNARVADNHSRNIFFVSLARSLGIAARIEPVTGKVQYMHRDVWEDVDFQSSRSEISAQGTLSLQNRTPEVLKDPKYETHFTVARILPDGRLQTLWFNSDELSRPTAIDTGRYLLITGTRMAKGNVLTKITSFGMEEKRTTNVALTMRENREDIRVIGSIDAEAKFRLEDGKETSILATTGRGYFIIGLLGARQEPTNHALRDIAGVHAGFDEWNRSLILLFKDEQELNSFDRNEFGTMPQTITYGVDADRSIREMLTSAMNLSNKESLPIFVIADTFGRVVFVSQGYTIGLGEQMMRTIDKLK